MVPVLSDFCCGCSLKTGCILIGALEIFHGVFFGGFGYRISPHRFAWFSTAKEEALLAIVLVISVSLLISGIILMVGTLKDNRVLLKGWVAVRGVLLACSMCSLIGAIIMSLNHRSGSDAAAFLFVGTLESVIILYFMLVVFSYNKFLLDENEANSRRLADCVRLNSVTSETLSFS